MDIVDAATRSRMMSGIRSKNTRPEILVRRHIHSLGFRFRLSTKIFKISPDIVLPKFKTAVFVHGCFWHRHDGCALSSKPKSNEHFWNEKFVKNVARDKSVHSLLTSHGWRVEVIWECRVRSGEYVRDLNLLASDLKSLA